MKQFVFDPKAHVIDVPPELLHRMARKIEKVHERMLKTAQALKQAGVPFAVIGGNAVAIWVETKDEAAVRNTKDVDIVLPREQLDRAKAAMEAAGFDYAEVNGVEMFIEKDNPSPKQAVHMLFIGEKVRPHYLHAVPGLDHAIESHEGVPAIGILELLSMKLQSFRDRDRTHVRDMLEVGLLTQDVIDQLPPDLRARMEQILTTPED